MDSRRSKDTQYELSERSNHSYALSQVEDWVGANRMLRIGKIESEANALSNVKDMQTDSR